MKTKKPQVPHYDFKTRDLINEFGGWVRVLHPDFQPSEEFLKCLAAADFSPEEFANLRVQARDAWLWRLASSLHVAWNWALLRTQGHRNEPAESMRSPFDGTARWSEIPVEHWNNDRNFEIMRLYNITLQQVEDFIIQNPENFYSEPWSAAGSPPEDKPPPVDPARVPRRPGPIAGGTEIALPLAEPQNDDET